MVDGWVEVLRELRTLRLKTELGLQGDRPKPQPTGCHLFPTRN
jgi:hypothetical protein